MSTFGQIYNIYIRKIAATFEIVAAIFSSSDDRLEGEDCSHPAASKAILLELRTNLYDYLVFVEVHGIGLFVARLG